MNFWADMLLDAAVDTARLAPFLFLTYLAMEYLENKAGEHTVALLLGAGKKGPLLGGLLGVLPQCGFAAAAANLYSGGVITAGTLLAVFLATSDEMLPVMLSERVHPRTILLILGGKVLTGVLVGLIADFLIRLLQKGRKPGLHIHEICEREHCHCEEGSILLSALRHFAQIVLFLFLLTLLINVLVESIGMERMIRAASVYPTASIFLTALIGMIPNCAASVAITTFYLEGVLSAGSMFAGLLACSGVGLLVLFRANRGWRVNLAITASLYGVSVLAGLFLQAAGL